jgi:hypothetical protein
VAQPPRELPQPGADEIEEGKAAIAEAAAVAGGLDLSSRADLNKLNGLLRRDSMEGHLHRILVAGLYVAGISITAMFVSLVWNMAAPDAQRFLNSGQVAALQSFLFSGAMGSALTAAARKVGGDEPETKD